MKKALVIFLLVALIAGVGLTLFGEFRSYPEPRIELPIDRYVPGETVAERYGWESEDLPIGSTEGLVERSLEVLKMDGYVYRRYTKGTLEFTVFFSYWLPGKMSPRDVNTHNPDVCWVNGGWTKLEGQSPAYLEGASFRSPQGEFGVYEIKGTKAHAYFWHLLDGEPYDYGSKTFVERAKMLIVEPIKRNFTLKREQAFIRIVSPQPFEQLKDDPFFQYTVDEVFSAVAR